MASFAFVQTDHHAVLNVIVTLPNIHIMISNLTDQSRFQYYFGKIPKGIKDHEDPYQHETHNLPEAYLGKNRFLMQTFDYLITKEGREFLTKVILPFEHTDNINVAWEVFQFDKTIADIEPEQGMPRYVTQSHDMYSDTLTRRGLAFVIEHGFYTTEIGKKHYLMNIQQIVDAVSDTCAYQVIRALLDEEDYYSQRELNESNVESIRREMSRFGIVQRGEHGMHILDSDLKDAMSMEGVSPTAYIFPARMSSYIRMRDPYMTEHARGGVGSTNLQEDPAILTFRGTRVYECRYFETDYIEAPFDPLEDEIVYNEYYIEDDDCDLYIFDMNADNWVKAPRSTTPTTPTAIVGLGSPEGGDSPSFMLSEDEFKQLNLRRFSQKTLKDFNAAFFTKSVSSHTAERVCGELRLLCGTETMIRPKFLNDLFATHSQP